MRGLLKTYYQKNNPQAFKNTQDTAALRESRSGSVAIATKKTSQQDLHEENRPKTKEEQKLARQKEKDRLRVLRAADRREQWVSMVANDPEFIEGYKNGSLPLFHVEHLKFRDFSQPGAITGLTGSIPKTSIEKHPLNKIPAYIKSDYDEHQPSNHPKYRDRILGKEVTSPIVKHTHKDQLERIQDKIQGTPKLSTEPINTLLLSRPQWREHDESKWVGGKEFQSMMSRKDQGWQPLQNVREEYREPFIENKVKFRDTSNNHAASTIVPLISSQQKKRNNSNVRTQIHSMKGSVFRNSPSRSSGGDDVRSGGSGSPAPEPVLFDSTIPADKTWKNRAIQSNSLRQKHHLDQSLKLRKNLLQKEYEHNVVDMRTQIAMEANANTTINHAVDLPKQVLPSTAEKPLSPPNLSTGKPDRLNSFDSKPFSPFTQQTGGGLSPLKVQGASSLHQQHKPPLPKKEHVINLEAIAPDVASNYLNHDYQNSYSQAWQYTVVVKAPVTYFNKKYEEKEELRDAHIIWEMDRERTYYKSAMEKIPPSKIKEQAELERQRRSNMIMALNTNVMDKTQSDAFPRSSNSLKKLPSSKRQSHRKITSSHGIVIQNQAETGYTQGDVYEKTNINGYLNTYSGSGSPIKQQMNQTQPKGFMSPKNSVFNNTGKKVNGGELNKQDIREVVKSYFDRNSNNRNYSPSAMSQSSPMSKQQQNSQLKQDQLASQDTQISPFHLSPVKQNSN